MWFHFNIFILNETEFFFQPSLLNTNKFSKCMLSMFRLDSGLKLAYLIFSDKIRLEPGLVNSPIECSVRRSD